MYSRTTATRIASLFGAAAMTALIVGSQVGLANGFTAEAHALHAARNIAPVAQNTNVAVPQPPGI